ncbi:Piso0_002483 [Millerozyma farinosa CBS 7064]|uniref:Piso0_002483 protein n=1 Tax=Pichia sorbitophila (strain ATCC MYA-4447 / BCRC 22081 / CBS 7064 / NBRC 10061 / NRRL Y-12695) TaxID=559304 RepID=G8YF61_PICSO|nr:Piso0_002483 [Millerozyma farinosa CBS 7064]
MNRLFGTKNATPKLSLNEAVQNIDERVGSLDVKLSKINSELSTYQQKISRMRDGPGKNALKQKALKLLRQRKQIEAQKDQLENQSWNMSQASMTTDNLKNTMITIDAMKTANKQLKQTYGKIDVDKVEELQDEMLDLIDKSNELQESLSTSYDVPDEISESELDAELDALGEEMDFESQLGNAEDSVPGYLNDIGEVANDNLPSFIDEPEEDNQNKIAN